jgi:hypothetical protein
MPKRVLASLVVVAVTLSGCAPASRLRAPHVVEPAARTQTPAATPTALTPAERALLAEYVQKLPVGSRVRVHLVDGQRRRATLMAASAERLVIQLRTRIPEPPLQVPLERIIAVELEHSNGSVGRAIGIGIAAGAAAILGVMLLLAAIYAD